MIARPHRSRFCPGLLLAIALGLSTGAFAGPQEDYDAGYQAYRSGDIVSSMPLLRSAADAGHVDAQLQYGYILDWSEENEEALRYYRMAADSGDPRGELELGRMYLNGEGVESNPAVAREWIERAAGRDHGPAVTQLAYGYLNGGLGLEIDEAEARRLFQRSVELGQQQAERGLAELERRAEVRRKAQATGQQGKQ